jgi:hypothetical protein
MIRARCHRIAHERGASQARRDSIAIAVTEAATNVVLYADPAPQPGFIHVRTSFPTPKRSRSRSPTPGSVSPAPRCPEAWVKAC